jgi:hypothetical protein
MEIKELTAENVWQLSEEDAVEKGFDTKSFACWFSIF